jgi:hypothetical protein
LDVNNAKSFSKWKNEENIGLKHNQMQKLILITRNGSHKWQIIVRNCKLIGNKTVFVNSK